MNSLPSDAKIIDLGYKPRPFQQALHKQMRRYNVLVCHRRFGKCLTSNTDVLTTEGFKKINQIKIGDYVYAPDGKPTLVTGTYYGGKKQIYEVHFSNREVIECDDDHLWYTEPSFSMVGPRANRVEWKCGKVITTKEALNTPHKLYIPTTDKIESSSELPIDPWLFGYWLGNGNKDAFNIAISYEDQHLVNGMNYTSSKKGTGCDYFYFSGYMGTLKKLGVFKNKHIPEIYKTASPKDRLSLLQGLMDSDGGISGSGTCRFDNFNETLINDTFDLIASLGWVPFKNLYSRLRDGVITKEFYILFTPKNEYPFTLERKNKLVRMNTRPIRHKIDKIVLTEKIDDVYCISIEHESKLFLVGKSLIPTHNTVFALRELQDKALQNPKERPQYAYVAPTYAQAKKVAWEYMKDFFKNIPGVEFHIQELKVTIPRPEREDNIIIYLVGADNPDSIRGMYFDGIIIDEYAQIAPSLWGEVIVPALSDRKGWAIFIGTPKGANHFKKIYATAEENMLKNEDSPWFAIKLKASQTAVIDPEELKLMKETMSPEEYDQEMECNWDAALRGAYYDDYMVRAENERRITGVPYDATVPVHTAWDLGIGDSTAIWFYQAVGREIHLIDYLEMSGKGLEWYVGKLKEKPYTYGTHFLPHDAGAKELGTGKTLQEQLGDLIGGGHMITVLKRLKVEDGIQAARAVLSKCYFDRVKTYRGIECLRSYQKIWDEKNGIFKDQPKHDEYSHGADAFRYLALSISKDVDRMNLPRDYYAKQVQSQENGQFWGF